MISKEDLGIRIRDVRKQRAMTLKDLERASGFSATHISEIERGKTSPTIGALVRIAGALEKEASYFLEEEQLNEVALVRRDERVSLPKEEAKVEGEYLTPGIPGGRLNAYMLYLDPGGDEIVYPPHGGEEGAYLVQGTIQYRVGERVFTLKKGDALHYPSDREHAFKNVGTEQVQMLFISTKRVRGKNKSSSGATGKAF